MINIASLPKDLPAHFMVTMDGEPTGDECPGGEPDNVEEDVGFINATCSQCRAPFVFSFKKESWVPDTDIEEDLQSNNPLGDQEILG